MNRSPRWTGGAVWLLNLTVLAGVTLQANDWPHWRGPDRNGISQETEWLDRWPAEGPAITWKANVGIGFASFAVAGKHVLTTGYADDNDTVFCFDADSGKLLWKHSFPSEKGAKFYEGGTTGTPTIAGGQVFTLNRWGDAFCFEIETGKIVWSKNVQKETGIRVPSWGYTGAPLVLGDRVILAVGEGGLALDRASGRIVWQSGDEDAGYATPFPIEQDGRQLIVLSSGKSYLAVDTEKGLPVWSIKWLTDYGVNAADPIVVGDRVFVSSGYGKGAALYKLGGAEPEVIWKSKVLRTQLNPAVLIGGYLYAPDGDTGDKPPLKCVELATGEEKWSFKGLGASGLIAADGKLIVLSDKGELVVAPASPAGFEPSARAQVLNGKCWTAPVLANGRIYCRDSRGNIAAVDVRRK